MESGATRNFEANRMWQLMEKREIEAVAEEERTNPMVALENRTAKSNQQMIMQENLEELYELAEKIGEILKSHVNNDSKHFLKPLFRKWKR